MSSPSIKLFVSYSFNAIMLLFILCYQNFVASSHLRMNDQARPILSHLKKKSKRKFLKKQISFPALRTYKIKVPWSDPDMDMETVRLIADAACTLSYHNMSQNEAFFFFAKSCYSLFLISNFLCVLICCYFYFLFKKIQKQKWMV